jgi:hypothetical protein
MNNNQQNPQTNNDFVFGWKYKLENFSKIIFILCSFIYLPLPYFKAFQITSGLLACVMALERQLGSIQFTKEFLAQVLMKDFTSTIFYLLLLSSIDKANFAFMFPVNIFFSIGASEFIIRSNVNFLKFDKLDAAARNIVRVKNDFKRGRCYVELFLFIYSLLMIFKVGFFFPLFFFNYLRLKSQTDPISYNTYFTFRNELIANLSNPKIPSAIGTIMKKVIFYFFKVVTNLA